MPWFKVDDKLHDHRKARSAGKAAMGVWVLAGSWSNDNLTDGFVPTSVAKRWGTAHDFAALTSAGLWEPATRDGERGHQFVNWSEFQPTKADVERERAKKAEAGRKGGIKSGASRREAGAQAGASPVVEPPNPNPTRTKEEALPDASGSLEGFEEFWDIYAKKVGRRKAEQKWALAIKKRGVTPSLLIRAATNYVNAQMAAGKHPEFTKDPATWLNGEHWQDEQPTNVHQLRTDSQGQPILPPLPSRSPWGN